ncbi:hypothetical protein N7478_010830 [Penicillium angulare]|uniref:uncharacterized protein n=1 Tax=Penicillium angulare TaxID=116970 RepID=UPI00253FDD48|nr:uncharacterized protein N7478_010830 [Penicillium angulare]KAJ5263225.1 hypothetical protein N7478_010830 [Penicillium angulare]
MVHDLSSSHSFIHHHPNTHLPLTAHYPSGTLSLENLETNMIIVEAKTERVFGKGKTQLLAYMGKSTASYQEPY